MTWFRLNPGGEIGGEIQVPGDKSISHRAVMFSALAHGQSRIQGFLQGEDTLATLAAFRAMGVRIDRAGTGTVYIHGVGLHGLREPGKSLDLGNSGTGMRLLAGLLCCQEFDSDLTGDASLRGRPMGRIIEPLVRMGGLIKAAAGQRPPLQIGGGRTLTGIIYDMPKASAQVKSCLLLAGLYAGGRTCVREPTPTRDHTERMLQGFGYAVSAKSGHICVEAGGRLIGRDLVVPGDISSAAFFLVGAAIGGTEVLIRNVGVNPTRTGIVNILRLMGANIELLQQRYVSGEPVADIRVHAGTKLQGINVPQEQVALAIDEFPAVFVAAAAANGETVVTGAEELRVKESDRIDVMAEGLAALGVRAEATRDGMRIRGGPVRGGRVDSRGDHRVAMALAMISLVADTPIEIEDCANVATSFPGFPALCRSAGLHISELPDD